MPSITITLPDVITCKVRGHDVALDLRQASEDIRANIAARLALYGMRKFNDASPMGEAAPTDEAGKVKFAADCANNAREMIKDWLAGDFATERSGGRTADPVAVEARAMALAYFQKKHGKYDPKNEVDKAKLDEYRKHPTIVERAKAAVAARTELDIEL